MTLEQRTIYDISPEISPNLAVWPGDMPFRREVSLAIAEGANIDLSAIHATVHLGAHADAPSHYKKEGESIEKVALEPYIGLCQVIEVAASELIRPEDFKDQWQTDYKRILFKTGSFPDPNHFNENFVAFSPEAIEYVGKQGAVLVGIDTPSVDTFHSKDLPSHSMLHQYSIRNLEGLVLKSVSPGLYELVALPLRIQGMDASPVRAILRDPT